MTSPEHKPTNRESIQRFIITNAADNQLRRSNSHRPYIAQTSQPKQLRDKSL